MNNPELERILKSAPVPERTGGYWEQFPKSVLGEIHRRETCPTPQRSAAPRLRELPNLLRTWASVLLSRPALLIGAAAACVLFGFFLGVRQGAHSAAGDPQFAEARKCFSEIATLFPNQVQALVLDAAGAHLVLAEQADVPSSPPLYVKITGPKGSQRFVTFSGQRIRVNGDSFEVLVDRQGEVLLVGRQSVWSSSEPGVKAGPYRIEARPLPTNS
jgi:hypothetical protein